MMDRMALSRALERGKKSELEKDFRNYRAAALQYRALEKRMARRFDDRCVEMAKTVRLPPELQLVGWIPQLQNEIAEKILDAAEPAAMKEAAAMCQPGWRERIERAQAALAEALRESPPEACKALVCYDFHVNFISEEHSLLKKALEKMERGEGQLLPASPQQFAEYVSVCLAFVRLAGKAHMNYMHTAVLLDALEIPAPAGVEALASDPLVKRIEEYRAGCWKGMIQSRRDINSEETLVRLLAEALHPKDAARIIDACSVKQPSQGPEPDQMEKLLGKVRLSAPFAEIGEVRMFAETLSADPWKISTAVWIFRGGASRDIAAWAAKNGRGARGARLISTVEHCLPRLGMSLDDAERVANALTEERFLAAFADGGERMKGWLAVMSPSQNGKFRLAALLSTVCGPPAGRGKLKHALAENDDAIIGAILDNDLCLDAFDDAYRRLAEYAAKFKEDSANGMEAGELETENGKPGTGGKGPETAMETLEDEGAEEGGMAALEGRPHESLAFSQAAESAMRAEGVEPEDVRRALVYGLRLSSPKAAIGGKYFMTAAFRDNVERVLGQDGEEIPVRRERVEKFLVRHGAISYYKGGDTIRLNIKKDRSYVEPSETGEDIIGSVLRWMAEFQKLTS